MAYQPELERIRTEYTHRSQDKKLTALYTSFHPGHLFTLQNRERVLLNTLKGYGYRDLSHSKILDVGCGQGHLLLNLVQYGAIPCNLIGIDLLGPWLRQARQLTPGSLHAQANAGELPFPDDMFDLVFMFTVLTSVPHPHLKKAIAAEAARVVSPNGLIMIYDFKYAGKNQHIQGVSPAEIRTLFPDRRVEVQAVSLAMPIAWRLAPHAWLVCALLERIPFLRTHYLATIQR